MSEAPRVVPFGEQDDVSVEDVLALWTGEAQLEEDEARRRLDELDHVAIAPDGGLAGVSTAYVARHGQLLMDLWHVRVYVAPAHRRSTLAIALATRARDRLSARFAGGEDRRAAGAVFEVQSPILQRHVPQAVWPRTRFAFVGENERGDHVRVLYFPGALAPEPEPAA